MEQDGFGWYDDRLLTALREALQEPDRVPHEVITAAKTAYSWRTLGAELAVLCHDSALGAHPLAGVRSNTDERTLMFEASELGVHVCVRSDLLVGQVIPAQAAEVELQTVHGKTVPLNIDESGSFTFTPLPAAVARLVVRIAGGTVVNTDWVRF